MGTPLIPEPGSRPQGTTTVDISVVVPAYNGERTIVDCLESLERAIRGRRGEIIVVDSSTDSTPERVRERFPGVTLIRSERRLSAGQARNRGGAAAHGQLIFFTDQDCVVPEDWFERIEEHLRDPSVDAVGGAVGIRNLSNLSGCALYFLEFLYQFPGNGRPQRDKRFLVGCNAAYRARVIREVRFPDQTLGEDVLFAHRVRSLGFHALYDPRIVVLHENRSGWRTFFAYNHRMGRAAAAYHSSLGFRKLFLRYPILAFVAPFLILPSVAASLFRSRPGYLRRFLLLAPICFLGNLVWASGFRQEALRMPAEASNTERPPMDDYPSTEEKRSPPGSRQ